MIYLFQYVHIFFFSKAHVSELQNFKLGFDGLCVTKKCYYFFPTDFNMVQFNSKL